MKISVAVTTLFAMISDLNVPTIQLFLWIVQFLRVWTAGIWWDSKKIRTCCQIRIFLCITV